MIKSICIVRLSALGDVLMALPLVRRLQATLPEAKLTWIISEPAYTLVKNIQGIDFIVIEKPRSLMDYWRFKKRMKRYTFDVLLAMQASLRANLLFPCIKASRKIGYDPQRANDGHRWFIQESIAPGKDHTLEGFLKFADVLNLPKHPVCWDMPIATLDCEFAQNILNQQPTVIVNAAASKPERSWMPDRYAEIICYLQEKLNFKVILTGGPGKHDRELADAILRQVSCVDLVGKTKPQQLIALIKASQLVICPDTGPAHMASAVGTPVIALHAVTNPGRSGAYLFQNLAINYYPHAVHQFLNKKPDDLVWGTPVHKKEAMALIPVSDVIARVEKVLT